MNKQWNEIVKYSNHSNDVTDFKFSKDAKSLVSCGMDRKVIVVGKNQ
jgi:WD40 repeat protein